MGTGLLHALIRDLYEMAGYEAAVPPGTGRLVGALFGANCIRPSKVRGVNERGVIALNHFGRWELHVDLDVSDEDLAMAYARCLARWLSTVRPNARDLPFEELAASIALPDAALAILIHMCGCSVEEIARFARLHEHVAIARMRQFARAPHAGNASPVRLVGLR